MYKILGADGREYGPVTAEQLRRWIAESRANAQTRVLAEGATEWKPLSAFPEFSASLVTVTLPAGVPAMITALPPAPRTNSMATAGFVMGILSLCCCWCCWCGYGVPFNVLGIIFSAIAISQINKDPQTQQGKGIAITGLILSLLGFVLAALLVILSFATHSFEATGHIRRL
ncbi:MAG: hypothetical protein C5B50_04420 [Verrucomicrobia bacterium]|nr:MAG: hypothetical protein C5B50_04420 [Verrucomicrobiota bacterium]